MAEQTCAALVTSIHPAITSIAAWMPQSGCSASELCRLCCNCSV